VGEAHGRDMTTRSNRTGPRKVIVYLVFRFLYNKIQKDITKGSVEYGGTFYVKDTVKIRDLETRFN
jgi:hypothetical protein